MKKRIFTLMMAFLAIAGNAVWGQENINITGIETQLPTPSQGTGWKLTHEDIGTAGNKLVISQSGKYVITDAADAAADNSNIQIIVNGNLEDVEITVKNVKTNAQLNNNLDGAETDDKYSNRCAFEINSGTTVTLNWEGTNKFWSSPERAGINVKPGATLILNDEDNSGTLEAGSLCNGGQAHTYGAGIGGDQVEPNFGTIIIENGQINARCESKGNSYSKFDALAAGIGGGYSDTETSTEGTIIIKGGTIEAASWSVDDGSAYSLSNLGNQYSYGAGIGGGWKGTCTNIAILGGKVTSNSKSGDDIGVGFEYDKGITEGIIIGQWAENTAKPTVNNGNETDINKTNYLSGENASINGEVSMPRETQIYIANEISNTDNFTAYNIELEKSQLGEGHSVSGREEADKLKNYYFGPSQSIEVSSNLTCTGEDNFLGWYSDKDNIKTPDQDGNVIFTAPSSISGYKAVTYQPVWVESKRTIVVKTGTEWTEDSSQTPEINYIPENAIDALSFEISKYGESTDAPAELQDWKFSGKKLLGKSALNPGETYKNIKVTVDASMDSYSKPVVLDVHVVENAIINKVSVNSNPHYYNGEHHNGFGPLNKHDHLLNVTMTMGVNPDGSTGTVNTPLQEQEHYRIYSYKVDGTLTSANDNDEKSVLLINAGTYNDVTIQALNATLAESLDPDHNTGKYKITTPIEIKKRPLDINISFDKTAIEEDEELTWDDVTVTPQTLEGNSGIVAKDAEDFKKAVTGKINYTLNEEGTIATVEIFDVEVSDQGEFLVSNYDLTINGKPYTKEMEVDLDEPEVPVTSSSTGGSFNDHRYQLFLANKDYLKTDEKTVEYYEDLKLELFSRHNKKYADAGGSFTVWYEKDGVANPGGYRLFWSKSGEHGDYQEVKFDEVSGYYQIRNVQSDVYVKIYDADGFPVANEAITAQDFRAYAQANKIIVITPEPTDVQIISMAGAVVAADKVTGQREFANLAEGVYIVRMGETIVKLQVRN